MAAPRRPRLALAACYSVALATLSGCASSLPPTTYVPARTEGVQTLRRGGSSYAAVTDARTPVLLSLESVPGPDEPLLRLRLRVQNRRDREFVLDPERDVFLERRLPGEAPKRIRAEPPSKALRLVHARSAGVPGSSPLRKTRVLPGQSVGGAVYFRGSGIAPKQAGYGYEITVHVRTPAGIKRVLLRPTPAPA